MIPILSTLVGKSVENPRTVIERGFRGVNTDTANCLIKASSVYCICDGTVIAVDRSPKTNNWGVTVDIGGSRWIRYLELSSTGVSVGKEIHKREFIGYGDNGYIKLEYCTLNKTNYPVRLLGRELYKQNPTLILFIKTDIADM